MEEYVKCISLTNNNNPTICPGEIGKIYKIREEHSFSDWSIVGIPYSVAKARFEPATKEEYDLQEGIYVKEELVENNNHEEALIKLLNKLN